MHLVRVYSPIHGLFLHQHTLPSTVVAREVRSGNVLPAEWKIQLRSISQLLLLPVTFVCTSSVNILLYLKYIYNCI